MMSSATLLKHRTPESFRENLMKAMQTVIYADGQVHDNERERVRRTERLLGLTTANLQKSA